MTGPFRRHPLPTAAVVFLLVIATVWAVNLVQLQRSVTTGADYWSQPRGQAGGLLYVALGDSTAQGIGASRPQKGYVSLIADRLRAATGQPVQVVNLSSSGARIRDVLDVQIPALRDLGHEADLVTVAIGGNDIRDYDRTRFAAETDLLTAALPAGSFVADAPYFMHGRWERDAQQAADLLSASTIRRNLRPVPLHEALKQQGAKAMVTQFSADWFHPNDRGHRVWADAFWNRIRCSSALIVGTTACVAPSSGRALVRDV